jgi:hypothetical protein
MSIGSRSELNGTKRGQFALALATLRQKHPKLDHMWILGMYGQPGVESGEKAAGAPLKPSRLALALQFSSFSHPSSPSASPSVARWRNLKSTRARLSPLARMSFPPTSVLDY